MADLSHPPVEFADQQLNDLAEVWLSDIDSQVQAALAVAQHGERFTRTVFDAFVAADSQISGPGLHTVVWVNNDFYKYPFDKEFEGVLRTLRYMPSYLSRACEQSVFVRAAVQMAGSCLENCLKDMFRAVPKVRRYARIPIGRLARTRKAKEALGVELAGAVAKFADYAANPAKHDFHTGRGSGPRFSFDDAVHVYFLARVLGAATIEATGRTYALESAVRQAAEDNRYFFGAAL